MLTSLRAFDGTILDIFITDYQELKYLRKGFDIGANNFIRKPFELEELQARIRNIKRQFSIDETIRITEKRKRFPRYMSVTTVRQSMQVDLVLD